MGTVAAAWANAAISIAQAGDPGFDPSTFSADAFADDDQVAGSSPLESSDIERLSAASPMFASLSPSCAGATAATIHRGGLTRYARSAVGGIREIARSEITPTRSHHPSASCT